MQGFRILKKIVSKQWDSLTGDRPDPAKAVDRDLPLGLRLNSIVSVDETDFILAGKELLTTHPSGNLLVKAIGRSTLWDTIVLHRFYLQNPEGQALLQIACDRRNEIEEIHLFRTFDEVYPATADEWAAWLDRDRGLIGWKDFSVSFEGGQLTYARTWQPDAGPYLEPVAFDEALFMDKAGTTTDSASHRVMLYNRQVNDDLAEYLMLSAEKDDEGAMVRIMSGITLLPSQLTIA